MAVTFFPFNSIVVGGVADRPANAENLAAYLAGFFSNGVLMQEDTALQVTPDSGMNVQIHAGVGNINGKTILNNAAEIVPIEAASLSQDRIDRVIFRLDEVNRLMEFDVLTGTPGSSPTAPELTQGADIYEMCLAEVRVPAGASSIIASYITDKRADSALCGYSSIPAHMHDMSKLGVADYIVEQGISGIWTYKKYNSGIIECYNENAWVSPTLTLSSVGNNYISNAVNMPFPTDLFIDIDTKLNVQFNFKSSGTYLQSVMFNTLSDGVLPIRILKGGSSTAAVSICAFAVGRWK